MIGNFGPLMAIFDHFSHFWPFQFSWPFLLSFLPFYSFVVVLAILVLCRHSTLVILAIFAYFLVNLATLKGLFTFESLYSCEIPTISKRYQGRKS